MKINFYIQQLFNHLRLIKNLGIFQTLNYVFYKSNNNKLINLRVRGYDSPFYLRGGTSDAWVFDMNIIRQEYQFFLPITEVKTIIDAGANIGTASRYFLKRFPSASIVAIEPDSANYQLLIKNTENYPYIKCLNGGLWSKDTKLSIVNNDDWKYALRVEENPTKGTIKAYSILGIMQMMNWDFIDVLKMDIEGSEIELFLRDYEAWSHKVGALVIELHPKIDTRGAGLLFNVFANRNFDLKYKGENLVLIFHDTVRPHVS